VGPAIPARKYVDGCQFGEESTSYARRIGLRLCRKSRLNGSERKAGVAQEDDAARVIGPQRIYRSPGGQLARRLANRFAPALDRLPAASLSGPASARARLRGSWFWRNHSKSLGRSFQAVHRVTRDSTLRTRRHRTGRMSPGCVRIPPDPRRPIGSLCKSDRSRFSSYCERESVCACAVCSGGCCWVEALV
jgi:hypothetical protein